MTEAHFTKGPHPVEVIPFGTINDTPPLLFVHGSYCGAWIWEPFFLPAFAERGFWGAAISLRGHGHSPGGEAIESYGLSDYLEDISSGVALFSQPPVLIGHSLGGYLVQKYALSNPARGLVLMSSPSLMGLSASAMHIGVKSPILATELGNLMTRGPEHANIRVITRAMFADPQVAESMIADMPPLQRESTRISFEASWPDWRWPTVKTPTLVIGGTADAFVPESDLDYESFLWSAETVKLPGAPHGLMVDPCWPKAAGTIMGWLKRQFEPR